MIRHVRRRFGRRHDGFSLAELMVVCAVVGILAAVSAPLFLTYLQSARVKSAAEQVAAFLNQGRQLAITTNQSVRVQRTSGAMSYQFVTSGVTWTGPGTDSSGNIRLPEGITLTAGTDAVFTYLGSASPAGAYTVRDTQSGKTLPVSVAASGRVRIGP